MYIVSVMFVVAQSKWVCEIENKGVLLTPVTKEEEDFNSGLSAYFKPFMKTKHSSKLSLKFCHTNNGPHSNLRKYKPVASGVLN